MTVADPLVSSSATHAQARASAASLSPFVDRDLDIQIAGQPGTITLPAEAVRLLVDALGELAAGRAVTVVTPPTDLTLAEAAEVLGVSVGFLARQLDAGELPAAGAGGDRRIGFADLSRYKQQMYDRRSAALAELSALDQELGLA